MKPTDADRNRAEQWLDDRSWNPAEWYVSDDATDQNYIDYPVHVAAIELATLIAQVRAEERERCARVADREAERLPFMNQVGKNAARDIAAAIREGDV